MHPYVNTLSTVCLGATAFSYFSQTGVEGMAMLSKCANPSCTTPFQYLREGKLYQIELESAGQSGLHLVGKKTARKVEHFWLCGPCSTQMTLAYQRGKGVITLPLPSTARAAVAS